MATSTNQAREESNALVLQRDMKDILKSEVGLHDEFAESIASALVRGWRKRSGKQTIYIPGESDLENRNAAIKREFNGTNRADICRKHNISRSRLYQIINGQPNK